MTVVARWVASRHFRSRQLRHGLIATTAVAVAATSLLGAATSADAATPAYVKAVPLCSTTPRSQHASCFAMRLVAAKAGDAGAKPAAVRPDAVATSGPAGGYTPDAVAKAYGVNDKLATTDVVGIVDAYSDPNVLADLNTFDAQYGLPAETARSLRVVNQRGATSPLPAANAGWAGEISLDVDAVRGLCHTCRIILVEADSNSFTDLAAAENKVVALGATVVTNSFGSAESGGTPSASYRNAFNHPGVVITASTGDDGFFDWDVLNKNNPSSNSPATPAAFTSVVAVGGTSLYLDNRGARASETVWNENGPNDRWGNALGRSLGASGGGCSTLYNAPAWQKSVTGYSTTGCGARRMVGDIAALADPYTGYDVYDSYQSTGWQTFGGTSLASPLVAALFALAGGAAGVDYPAQTLYANYGAGTPTYDVTVGSNGACGGQSTTSCAAFFGGSPNVLGYGTLDCAWQASPSTALAAQDGQCYAKVGYDGPSGIGSPAGLAIFQP